MIDTDFLLTNGAAKRLDRSPQSVRHYADTGRLPCVRTLDGVRLFKLGDVVALRTQLAERTSSAGN